MQPLINFQNVNKSFDPDSLALQNVNLEIQKGEFVCILGSSGSGKTTLLNIISGLATPTSGVVQRPEDVAMVFQNAALLPWMNVLENVEIAIEAKQKKQKSKTASSTTIRAEALKYLDMMGLKDFLSKYPRELSGGQRQRVGIARALAVNTEILILDEPFSALDMQTTIELHLDLLKIWKETQKTIVMVSHSIEEAVSLASRVVMVTDHTVSHIFPISIEHPRHEQSIQFMAEVNRIRAVFLKKK